MQRWGEVVACVREHTPMLASCNSGASCGRMEARGGARGASGPTRREDKSAGYPVLGSPQSRGHISGARVSGRDPPWNRGRPAHISEPKSAAATRPVTEAARLTFLELQSAAATRPGTEEVRLTSLEPKSAAATRPATEAARVTILEPKSAAATRPGTEAARLTILEPKSAAATRPGTEAARLTFLSPRRRPRPALEQRPLQKGWPSIVRRPTGQAAIVS